MVTDELEETPIPEEQVEPSAETPSVAVSEPQSETWDEEEEEPAGES